MAPRLFRIVRTDPRVVAVCERCNMEFTSPASERTIERAEVWDAFSAHKCVPQDESQKALRIAK